ncbi:unnamed protein product [Amaranthus hypochondriacus]
MISESTTKGLGEGGTCICLCLGDPFPMQVSTPLASWFSVCLVAAADLNAIWIFSVPLSFDVGVPWTTEAELRRLGWASMTEGEIPTSKLCELGFDRWFDRSSSIAVFAGLLQGGDVVGESRMS